MSWLQRVIPFVGMLLLLQRTPALTSQQFHLINGSLTWSEAQSFCRLKYTDLATVNNVSDRNELANTLGSHVTNSWIGLRKGNTPRWMWSDGRGTAQYTRWYPYEPSGDGPCVEVFVGGTWNDVVCGHGKVFACYETQPDGTDSYVFYSPRLTWEDSQEQCRAKHTDLAYISSDLNNSAVANQANAWKNNMWIGLFSDAWMWSDGGETSFRYWLRGSSSPGDCASVAVTQQGRWVAADCNKKSAFVCHGGLKAKKMFMRMTVRSDVDLTDSTISDALLEKLEMVLSQQSITDINVSWRRDSNGDAFRRQLKIA
ncbi:hypothetical protein PBY51_005877 [Eleginops maclovinus]|uniref:C-type lectin domain-containing protein n=1 Tax=Eleginops maclovinus TaxID=56733 RepID=A0AAN7WW05_ELEMC|nr:hypothetical protein PBY51_005877 [Eleginops maclovinus]